MKSGLKHLLDRFLFRYREVNGSDSGKGWILKLVDYSRMPLPELYSEFDTDQNGLLGQVARDRLEKVGLNQISYERPPTWYELLIRSYLNPFNILLSLLCLIYYFTGDTDGTLIIVTMVVVSTGIRFVQEYRSLIAAEKLKEMVKTMATVIRHGDDYSPAVKYEIPMEDLVPGDVVALSAGDMVPADLRLITSKELFISQSSLTGEAMPVEKHEKMIPHPGGEGRILDTPNLCFLGTNVLNGTATGVILSTGNNTFFGSMAKKISGYRPLTSFDIGINQVTWLLIRFMFAMVPIVFLINGFTKGDWFEAFLFALSVAVGLIPEMLPMIVTANLAKGAVKMAESKVIVKHLNSIQNFGAMNILCTDKTGTLTQDRIILERHLAISGEDDEEVLKYGYLNSYYQTGLKNLMDVAVLDHSELKEELHLDKAYKKKDEIPFDFLRRRMSVVVEDSSTQDLLICKGSVDEVLSVCTEAKIHGEAVPLSDTIKAQALQLVEQLNDDGLRVLAVAYKNMPFEKGKEYINKDENHLVLMGFLAFLDPPKQTAEAAIEELLRLNVQVKVLTGDNEVITKRICKWVGLSVEHVLNGPEIDQMSDEQLKEVVDKTSVFAKLFPLQKSRIIALLKGNGHVVGFLGDGINDAPALRESDVGISVDTAVDIAKESADIIMLEKSLMFLKEGVLEGRKTFGNIMKYIKMAVSSNFGNVFSVLGASAILPFLPMLPLQLLVQNLLYDISQITIPFDSVDSDVLEKPSKWNPKGILKFMIFIGPISSIFDYTTFALMWFVYGANSIDHQALFQSGWFVEGLLSQTLIVHMIRTQKIPFLQSIASFPLLASTAIIMAVGIFVPYTGFGASIGLVPLPASYFPWLLLTLLCYCVLTQCVKVWFIKRFNFWL